MWNWRAFARMFPEGGTVVLNGMTIEVLKPELQTERYIIPSSTEDRGVQVDGRGTELRPWCRILRMIDGEILQMYVRTQRVLDHMASSQRPWDEDLVLGVCYPYISPERLGEEADRATDRLRGMLVPSFLDDYVGSEPTSDYLPKFESICETIVLGQNEKKFPMMQMSFVPLNENCVSRIQTEPRPDIPALLKAHGVSAKAYNLKKSRFESWVRKSGTEAISVYVDTNSPSKPVVSLIRGLLKQDPDTTVSLKIDGEGVDRKKLTAEQNHLLTDFVAMAAAQHHKDEKTGLGPDFSGCSGRNLAVESS